MYCTGGIRCERASALLRQRLGVKEVYQLQGGIHRYIDTFGSQGLWEGKNFVFDRRVAIGNLQPKSVDPNSSATASVVGHCGQCGTEWDEYDKKWRCSLCNSFVLLCRSCGVKRNGSTSTCSSSGVVAKRVRKKGTGTCDTDTGGPTKTASQFDELICGLCRSRRAAKKSSVP